MEHLEFLHKKFIDITLKSQWVVLPAEDTVDLPGLRILSPDMVPQCDRMLPWVCEYTWLQVYQETLQLAPLESMQFGHALDWILCGQPQHNGSPILEFPSQPDWRIQGCCASVSVAHRIETQTPYFFSATTETIANLAYQRIRDNVAPAVHPLD